METTTPDIANLIYSTYEEARKLEQERTHLGASQIGRPCERELWYSFKRYPSTPFSGRMLRLFETGKREEERVIEDLKRAGFNVVGTQDSSYVNGFGGSIDGRITIGDKVYILEVKTHNQKSFDALVKNGVAAHKPEHFAQMQVYMGRFGIHQALYFAVNKNTDEIYTEVVEFAKPHYEALTRRAERIINSEEPPRRLNDSPAYYVCKMCSYRDVCHSN